MRLAIKNQYTSGQKLQIYAKSHYAVVPAMALNQTNYDEQDSRYTQRKSLHVWRKTDVPTSTASHVGTKISAVERPNGYVRISSDASLCPTTWHNAIAVPVHVRNTAAETGCVYDASNHRWHTGNPERGFKRTASTVIDRAKYHATNKERLESNGLLIEQRQRFVKDPAQKYVDARGEAIAPSDSPTTGSQVRLLTTPTLDTNCRTTTYKPRNWSFQTNGAVSSSARTAKLQHGTLTRENHVFRSTHGVLMKTNYLVGAQPRYTIKRFTERNCNVGNQALAKIRHANRNYEFVKSGCFNTCVCP